MPDTLFHCGVSGVIGGFIQAGDDPTDVKEKPEPRSLIQWNAKRIKELRDRITETFKLRSTSPYAMAEWARACHEFHTQYDSLAFPGGYEAGLQKIRAGDPYAIGDALAFLEERPYFFRSQYMRKKLRQLLKHAPLTDQQLERFQRALELDKKKALSAKSSDGS